MNLAGTRLAVPNPYRGLRGLPPGVWIVAAVSLVNRAGTMALPFLALYFTEERHVSPTRAGLALATYGLGGIIVAPVAGRLSDRIGPFLVMGGSLAAAGIVLLFLPLAKNYGLTLLLVFVWAVVSYAEWPASSAALAEAAGPGQRQASVALNRLAVNVGMAVGPAVGGFLVLSSFRLLFVVDGLTSIAASLILWLLVRARPGCMARRHVPVATRSAVERNSMVWRDRSAMLFFLICGLFYVVYSQQVGALPLFLVRNLHIRESFFGTLYVVNTLMIIAIEVPLNLAMAGWSSRRAAALALALVAVAYGSLAAAHTPGAILLSTVTWTFGEMIFLPTATVYVAELAPAGRTGEYMGAFTIPFSVATVVGPWLGTSLLDRFGGPLTWTAMLAIGLAGAALASQMATHRAEPADYTFQLFNKKRPLMLHDCSSRATFVCVRAEQRADDENMPH